MNGQLQAVLGKVKGLLALSKSTNEHEAAAAAAAAHRLIQAHRLEEAELEGAGVLEAEPVEEDVRPLDVFGGRRVPWRGRLSAKLAQHLGCTTYLRRQFGQSTLRIIGRPSDVAALRVLFAWCVYEIDRLALARSGYGARWIRSYREGCVDAIGETLRREKEIVPASTAMVLVEERGAKAAEYLVEHVKPKAPRPTASYDPEGYIKGRRDGQAIDTKPRKQIAGQARREKAKALP
jgi:Protein of unknown function (DUF2786)